MTNKEIAGQLKLTQQLLELHGANPFKVKAYSSAIYNIDQSNMALEDFNESDFSTIGIKEKMAQKIFKIIQTGRFDELNELLECTPQDVFELLNIKGLGAKKVHLLWQDHQIDSVQKLKKACEENSLTALKGFGEKTQEKILENILYTESQQGNFMYAEILPTVDILHKKLNLLFNNVNISGQVIRQLPVVNVIKFIIKKEKNSLEKINTIEGLSYDEKISGPLCWRGTEITTGIKTEIILSADIIKSTLEHHSSPAHLALTLNDGKTIYQAIKQGDYSKEEEFYQHYNFNYIPPACREGQIETLFKTDKKNPQLLQLEDIKGPLHNHCTYSDGRHTLTEMAQQCREMGYEYLGISDHSKTATYARGLTEERIEAQHTEIEALNSSYTNFKIFKGIESDILMDGSLDYSNDVLKSFDFIVASIHSGLEMDKEKATQRLITAIENPYTTILGHPTARLLTRRAGYPINHKKVIDACADNQVVIEINANPWRLDIDWKWVSYCLEKGVMLSINPDAHHKDKFSDMYFGVLIGQKGGLTKEMNLNSKSLTELESYFSSRKK